MYETFFGLKRRPFLLVPDAESYFSAEFIENSRREIMRTLQDGLGISLVFGASGTGKTLLLQEICQSLPAEYSVAFVSSSRLETPKDLFLQLIHDLHLPCSGGETVELRLKIIDLSRHNPVVLIFDEAQNLSPAVLEEIRLLADSIKGSALHFRPVLAGTMIFEEKLTLPNLEAFNQRVVTRCYLDSFTGEETVRYITRETDELRIDPPNSVSPPLFSVDAKRQIYQLTDGVPRLINLLCGTALQSAAERKADSVGVSLVNDAWASLQSIEPYREEALASSALQEPAISPEQIEEIIDRKKKTFRLRQFDPVEFGILTDSDAVEMPETYIKLCEKEYKPPYPEDDADFAEEDELPDDSAVEEKSLSACRLLQVHVPGDSEEFEVKPSIQRFRAVVIPRRKFVSSNVENHRRKTLRRVLLRQILRRADLFALLLRKKAVFQSPLANESDMNEKTLQEYGTAVLEGRPLFIRKEPHYAYQTHDPAPKNSVTYPDPQTGVPVALRWYPEQTEKNERFGVSYSEFLNREIPVEPMPKNYENRESTGVGTQHNSQPAPPEESGTANATPALRVSLNASLKSLAVMPCRSGLEEVFEESQRVGGSAVSLAELFRVDSAAVQESAEFKSLDAAVQRQLESAIRRIAKAAEKIEQAATVSERAGQNITIAADFVETEVKAALPSYTDLFRQWSEFQNLITAELESAQHRESETLKFPAFQRRQVMIERTVPTIDVESLLR